MKTFSWRELPFPIDIDFDKFLPTSIDEDDSEGDYERDNMKVEVMREAFSSLTDIQLVVFLMRYAFGLRQKDIASTLRSSRFKKLNLMSKKTKCKSLVKQERQILEGYKEKFDREFTMQLGKLRTDKVEQLKKAEVVLKIDRRKLNTLTDRDIARRLTLHKLKVGYNIKVEKLLSKFKTKKSLDIALSKTLPTKVTQPYISMILKASIKKIKENLGKASRNKELDSMAGKGIHRFFIKTEKRMGRK